MRFVRQVAVALPIAAVGVGAFAVVSFAANGGDSHQKVTLCHATGSQSNPYVSVDVNISSAGDAADAKGHNSHADDIIPPYSYTGQDGSINYVGKNWTAEGQDILNDGCKVVDDDNPVSPTPPPTSNPSPSPNPSPSSEPTPSPSSNPTPSPSSNPTPSPSSNPTPSPSSNPTPPPTSEGSAPEPTPTPTSTPTPPAVQGASHGDPLPPTTGVA